MNLRIALLLAALLPLCAQADYARSKKALRTFVNQQACPSTGQHWLPCPGNLALQP